jgi:protocatechuate 3,4-dioxygenase beta subunit
MIVDADEGPFYPVVPIPIADDLTRVASAATRAQGEVIYMFGRVMGPDCQPVRGALVEIWQADMNGQYVHPRAPAKTPIDPNFRYFSSVRSAADGFYRFRTIQPAPYEVFGLRRAPHIHVRVKSPGHVTMTSEMYFAGPAQDVRRRDDRIFGGRGPRRNEMIVAGRPAATVRDQLRIGGDDAALSFEYELSLKAATR